MLWQRKMRRSIQFKIVLGLHESHDPLVLHWESRGAPLEILGAFVVAFLSKGLDSKCFLGGKRRIGFRWIWERAL